MSEPEHPEIVDDWYWLRRAATIVAESAEQLDEGARAIAAAMAWFWTVYSAAATAALAIGGQEVTWPRALLMAAPALSIFVAYSLATWASLPISVRFNVVAPEDIKEKHEAVIRSKRRRLGWSFGFAAVSALLVAAVVLGSALEGRPADDVAFAVARAGAGNEVVVGGRLSKETRLLVRVTPAGQATVARVIAAEQNRPFALAVPVPRAASYDVQASWAAGGRTTELREVLAAP